MRFLFLHKINVEPMRRLTEFTNRYQTISDLQEMITTIRIRGQWEEFNKRINADNSMNY